MPVQFKKDKDFENRLKAAFQQDMKQRIIPALETAVKEETPVRTGLLKSKIVGEMTGDLEGEVGTNTEYAIFVEYGTVHMAARAMFRKGAAKVEQLGDKLFKAIKEVI